MSTMFVPRRCSLAMVLTLQEPRRPRLLPLRLAGPGAAGAVYSLCNADMVEP